jgi:hypothetical protein
MRQQPDTPNNNNATTNNVTPTSPNTTLLQNSNNLNFFFDGGRAGGGGGGGGGGVNGRVGDSATAAKIEQEILHYLRAVLEAHERSKVERVAVSEWQEVARVLDKVFFWLFVSITATSTLVLLVISPMTKDVGFEHST